MIFRFWPTLVNQTQVVVSGNIRVETFQMDGSVRS